MLGVNPMTEPRRCREDIPIFREALGDIRIIKNVLIDIADLSGGSEGGNGPKAKPATNKKCLIRNPRDYA